MAFKKYINISEVAELTGRPHEEIRSLAQTGVLPAHKARRGHWRLNVDAVEKYFGIQINKPTEVVARPAPKVMPKAAKVVVAKSTAIIYQATPVGTRLMINEDDYQEIRQRICSAKSSIKIMTADFKRFNLKPTDNQGNEYKDGTPFIKYLMAKAVQGVSVQIICSRPSQNFLIEWEEYYQQMGNPELFQYMFCIRNHAKVVIIDERVAYVGSANVTPAGLGQGIFTPGNFEASILTDEPNMILSAKALFSKVWDKKCCAHCHRADRCHETAVESYPLYSP